MKDNDQVYSLYQITQGAYSVVCQQMGDKPVKSKGIHPSVQFLSLLIRVEEEQVHTWPDNGSFRSQGQRK